MGYLAVTIDDETKKVEYKESNAPTISQLEILDGSDTSYAAGEVIQYVNLPKEEKFVDGNDICNLDRLGRNIRVKVIFDKPGVHEFQIELAPYTNNIKYSSNEKSSNENYNYEEQVLSFETDDNGEKIIDGKQLYIDVAGNNIYQIKAKDCNEVEITTSASIKTMRMLYYSEAKMQGLTSALPTAQLASVEAEYLKHGIKLVRLNTHSIPLMENIDKSVTSEVNTFFLNVARATLQDKSAKMLYYFTIAYTGHLARKGKNTLKRLIPVTVSTSTSSLVVDILDSQNIYHPLWYNITANDNWYVDCYFVSNNNSNKINIPKNRITPIQTTQTTVGQGCCDNVSIDISFLPSGSGKIYLEVNYMDIMMGGMASQGGDIVTICTKSNWQNASINQQIKTIIHEIGHMIGMTSTNGNKKRGLDGLPTWYDNTNTPSHKGDHCFYGITVAPPYDSTAAMSQSKCVMYGGVSGSTLSSFCQECSNRVRKTLVTVI